MAWWHRRSQVLKQWSKTWGEEPENSNRLTTQIRNTQSEAPGHSEVEQVAVWALRYFASDPLHVAPGQREAGSQEKPAIAAAFPFAGVAVIREWTGFHPTFGCGAKTWRPKWHLGHWNEPKTNTCGLPELFQF